MYNYNPGPQFTVTSKYGWRRHPRDGVVRFHHGVDYAAPKGTPVPAAYEGVVVQARWYNGYGNTVVIKHKTPDGKEFYTLYAHLSEFNVKVGQKVNTGDIIGKVGDTGISTRPHLHFEVIIGDKIVGEGKKTVDPMTFNWVNFYDYNTLKNNSLPSNYSQSFPTPNTYTVRPGDTLSKIAKRFGVSVNDLLRANPWIKNPDYILPGWKLRIPSYAEKSRQNLNEGIRRIDPLVIDLNGDGIKLIDIKESRAMFDLSGSGFANRVGWVSPDDGFLVWDRNNNGRIDDISEMFGNSTQSGFQALSLYDTNKDGKIDALDEIFKYLKVWQDKNGNGRTDEGELISLSDLGIKAIYLNTQKTNITQGGNLITEISKVEFEDGRTTEIGNVEFQIDKLYSYYNREVELNPETIWLPWVKGYGFMPDLHIAMSLDETLLNMVKEAISEEDLTKLKDKFEKIIFRWAGVENITAEELGLDLFIGINIDRTNRVVDFGNGTVMSFEQLGSIAKFTGTSFQELRQRGNSLDGNSMLEAWNIMFKGLFTRFVVDAGLLEGILPVYYDFFTDRIVIDENFDTNAFSSQLKEMFLSGDTNQISLGMLSLLVLEEVNQLSFDLKNFIKDLYTDTATLSNLLNNPYAELLIKPILGTSGDDWLWGSSGDDIIIGKEGNDYLYGNSGNDVIYGEEGDDYLYGGSGDDYLYGGEGNDYIDGGSGNDVIFGGTGNDRLYGFEGDDVIYGEEGDDVLDGGEGSDYLYGGEGNDYLYGWSGDDYLYGGEGNDYLSGGSGNDVIHGEEGDDILYGEDGDDTLIGGPGNDTLYAGSGNDVLEGGEGNDYLYGWDGDDVLIGGPGNDYMYGGPGNDTYVFNRGDGQDTIIDNSGYNILQINTDKDKIVLFRDGDDLVVGYSQNDFVRVINQFKEDEYYGIERIQVKDGYYITRQDIENIVNALIDFNADRGMDYTQKYNDLLSNNQFLTLLSQSWNNTHRDILIVCVCGA